MLEAYSQLLLNAIFSNMPQCRKNCEAFAIQSGRTKYIDLSIGSRARIMPQIFSVAIPPQYSNFFFSSLVF